MKPLSKQMQIELGIERKFRGKFWAYVPVMAKGYGWALGIAVANEAGYSPVPAFFCNAERREEMVEFAEKLNAARGIDPETEMRIVCSSMAAGKVNKKIDGSEFTLSGVACPVCDRIMSVRERDEQGACNDCSSGS